MTRLLTVALQVALLTGFAYIFALAIAGSVQ